MNPLQKRLIQQTVDKLGEVKAQIAALTEEEDKLKGLLQAEGLGEYQGTVFDAVVFQQSRTSLDMAAVRRKLTGQFLRAHSRTTESVVVKVTARKRDPGQVS